MKKKAQWLVMGILLVSNVLYFSSCSKDEDNSSDNSTNATLLTQEEEHDLLVLREEEKLARDVYLYAYDKYGIKVHKNISNSEQRHMDKVLDILTQYGLSDPADTLKGVFNNPDLQALYNTLCNEVDKSSMDALLVGATIEDLDIYDIEEFMARTTKSDILAMYDNLKCGSRNHMRSFYDQITMNNGSYTPQYISQAEFDAIVNSEKESCEGN